jgi:hypothetical protein
MDVLVKGDLPGVAVTNQEGWRKGRAINGRRMRWPPPSSARREQPQLGGITSPNTPIWPDLLKAHARRRVCQCAAIDR